MKFHMASLGNISGEIGKIIDLGHVTYITICLNDVGSYDVFP